MADETTPTTAQTPDDTTEVPGGSPQDHLDETQTPQASPQTPPPTSPPSSSPANAPTPQGGPQDHIDDEEQDNQLGPKTDLSKPQQPQASSPTSPQALANNPSVQRAGILRHIAETLAGGPRYKTVIDANTGQTTHVAQPMSKTDITMAIALEALSGSLAGLAQRGPNATALAGVAGLQQGQQIAQQRQQAQQQSDQQAQDDFKRQQQTTDTNILRAATVARTNFQMHENAVQGAQMDIDFYKRQASNYAPIVEQAQGQNAIRDQHVRGGDLLDKYHVTQDMAIPDGYAPVYDPNTHKQAKNADGSLRYEQTYTVLDPEAKISIPDQTLQFLATHHVKGYYHLENGKAVPNNFPTDMQARLKFVADGMAAASSINIAEAKINKQIAAIDPDGAKKFDVNLTNALDSGNVTTKSLSVLARYAGVPLDKIQAQMDKDKIPSDIQGQITSLLPNADVLDKMRMTREAAEAKNKAFAAIDTPAKAEAVLADGTATPQQKQVAQGFLNNDTSHTQRKAQVTAQAHATAAYTTGYNAEQGHLQAKTDMGVPLSGSGGGPDAAKSLSHPELVQYITPDNYNTPNGTNDTFLQALRKVDPGRAGLVQALSEGRELSGHYNLAKEFGGTLAADVQTYNPHFDITKVREYEKAQLDLAPNGKIGSVNAFGNAAFKHLANLYDSIGVMSALGMSGSYDINLDNAADESSSFYANGKKPDKDTVHAYKKDLGSKINAKGRDAVKQQMVNMMEKWEANFNEYQKALPSSFVVPQGFMAPDTARIYTAITGRKVNPRMLGATAIGKGGDGHNYYLDANHKPLMPVQ